jgi:hypothetical protein
MAKLTTDTSWTQTLAAGSYDIQKRGAGDVYVGRGTVAPTNVGDTIHLQGSAPLRLTVKTGDTAYFYGNGVEVYYSAVE